MNALANGTPSTSRMKQNEPKFLVVDLVGKLESLVEMSLGLFSASYVIIVFGSMVQFSRP
jgi:hypothetical protein